MAQPIEPAASHAEGTPPLDRAVRAAREQLDFAGIPNPRILFLVATGPGHLAERLGLSERVELETVTDVAPWDEAEIHSGFMETKRGSVGAWLIEDRTADMPADSPAWGAGFPCWLAARAGASLLVHVSAGAALDRDGTAGPPVGSLAVATDHLNLSGGSPLVGIGDTTLGPLFPDLSRLHHEGLRADALRAATKLGIELSPAIVACSQGPTRDTPAERVFFARAGADVSVQGLATPLISAAHAGLSALSLIAITEDGSGATDLPAIIAASEKAAPAVEDLILELVPSLVSTASQLAGELDA